MPWILTYDKRPWSLNVERQGNRWQRAELVKEWRGAFYLLAKSEKIPPLQSMWVIVTPTVRNLKSVPDTGACIGAAKAAIDGLVDAHVLPDDGPHYVKFLGFRAPEVGSGDSLTLEVHGQPLEQL